MMLKTCLLISLIALLTFNSSLAQPNENTPGEKLESLFNRLAISEVDSEKTILNDSIGLFIEGFINTDSAFYNKFENIRFLGQIMSPDSLVKILTWNVAYTDGLQNYHCYFLVKPSAQGKVKSYKLFAESGIDVIRKDTTYSGTNWYGALYYDLRPITLNGEKLYVLLGLDFKNVFLSRKIIEIVKFGDSSDIIFGKRVFLKGNNLSYREVFEFSSRANMTMRFNGENDIIFDHLSPFSPDYKDNFQYYGPDFSYDSYVPEKGMLRLKEDIDIRNQE